MISIQKYTLPNSPVYTPILFGVLFFSLWISAYFQAFESAIDVWVSSRTFNHCLIVGPLVIYFIWRERSHILLASPTTNPVVIAFLFLLVGVWAIGYGGGVQLLTHIAAFASLPLAIWYGVGNRVAKKMWFPLVFTLFCIPIGEELIPCFQSITADLSVALLRLSDIPVYRNGLYITIPNGRFEVAEACSGIRFFISTITLGCVYAYINYQSSLRRMAFIAVATVLPIIANGARAYGIMLIAYLSDMEHAAGADHLIYGWLFFFFILILLYLIGSLWSERSPPKSPPKELRIHQGWNKMRWPVIISISVTPFISVLLWKHVIDPINENQHTQINRKHIFALQHDHSEWLPVYPNATDSIQSKLPGADDLDVFVAWYAKNERGKELISWENRLFRPDYWTLENKQYITLRMGTTSFEATLIDIRASTGRRRLILYWYEMLGGKSGNPINTKLRQALNVLTGKTSAGGIIAISREYDKHDHFAWSNLQSLVTTHYSKVANVFPFQ